jgi:uncharacterized protein YqjF (DUF2071 family)
MNRTEQAPPNEDGPPLRNPLLRMWEERENSWMSCASPNNEAAKSRLMSRRGEPLFLSDWERALFLHFEVDAAALQKDVPFELDLREGKAYVSLVAFAMRRLRPRLGGRLMQWCFQSMAGHELLNLRTYVRHRGEAGIFFLAEWIPNRLSAFLGPRTFGLPYRLGRLEYHHRHEEGRLCGCVETLRRHGERQRSLRLEYIATLDAPSPPAAGGAGRGLECRAERTSSQHLQGPAPFRACHPGSLDEFLMERYTAFTKRGAMARFFRVWHSPWPQAPARLLQLDDSLLRGAGSALHSARLIGANYSPGVQNVWMGWPHEIETVRPHRRVLSAFYEMP